MLVKSVGRQSENADRRGSVEVYPTTRQRLDASRITKPPAGLPPNAIHSENYGDANRTRMCFAGDEQTLWKTHPCSMLYMHVKPFL